MKIKTFALAAILAATAGFSQAATLLVDGDTVTTGSGLGSGPLVTSEGTINFTGEFLASCHTDSELVAAGQTGACFDIFSGQTASLSWTFNVSSVTFVYGGNGGSANVQVRDSSGSILDSFTQASTASGQPAGPATLTGTDIRSLTWFDTSGGFLALDNIVLETGSSTTTAPVPLPAGLPLLLAGLGGLALLRRRKS